MRYVESTSFDWMSFALAKLDLYILNINLCLHSFLHRVAGSSNYNNFRSLYTLSTALYLPVGSCNAGLGLEKVAKLQCVALPSVVLKFVL